MFPAYAGMIPAGNGERVRRSRVPRICGDDPYPMLGVWAIHEAHLAHDRIDRLEERLKALEGKIDNGIEE